MCFVGYGFSTLNLFMAVQFSMRVERASRWTQMCSSYAWNDDLFPHGAT
jgi:hypothetical protein